MFVVVSGLMITVEMGTEVFNVSVGRDTVIGSATVPARTTLAFRIREAQATKSFDIFTVVGICCIYLVGQVLTA